MDSSGSPTPEPDATAPRRSGRVVRAPSKFAPEPAAQRSNASKRKRGDGDEDDAEDDNQGSDEDMSDDDEDDDAESDEDHPAPRSRKSAQTGRAKKPSLKKPKINGHQPARSTHATSIPSRPKKSVRIEAGDKGTGLFGRTAPLEPLFIQLANASIADVFGSGDSADSVARQWLEAYRADGPAAMTDLVNCILQCAGCDQEVTPDDVTDPDVIPTRLKDLQSVHQEVCLSSDVTWAGLTRTSNMSLITPSFRKPKEQDHSETS